LDVAVTYELAALTPPIDELAALVAGDKEETPVALPP